MVDLKKARQKIRTRPVGSTTLGGRSKTWLYRSGRAKFLPKQVNALAYEQNLKTATIFWVLRSERQNREPGTQKNSVRNFTGKKSPIGTEFSSRYKKGFLTQGFIPNGEVVIWKGLTLPGGNRFFPHPSVCYLPPVPVRGFCRQVRQYPG